MTAPFDFKSAPPWTQWKFRELGTHEVGNNAGPNIERYIRLGKCGSVGDPWCAIFENASLEASNLPGTRSPSSQSFRYHSEFVKLPGPALGAIAVFWRLSKSSGLGHVGDYVGETDDRVYILGGNEGDAVRIEPFAKQSPHFGLRDYWWPKSVNLPRIGAIKVADTAAFSQIKVT